MYTLYINGTSGNRSTHQEFSTLEEAKKIGEAAIEADMEANEETGNYKIEGVAIVCPDGESYVAEEGGMGGFVWSLE